MASEGAEELKTFLRNLGSNVCGPAGHATR